MQSRGSHRIPEAVRSPCGRHDQQLPPDTPAEHTFIRERALAAGADFAVSHDVHACGGAGGIELAEAVVEACEKPSEFRFLYADEDSIETKIAAIATKVYGAKGVTYSSEAEEALTTFKRLGYGHMPVCMARTQFSLAHDPAFKGRPRDWHLPVRDVRASVGAGFLYPLAADIRTMPGLPTKPAGNRIDLDESGSIVGLS